MSEMFDKAMELLGFALMVIMPVGLMAAFVDWKSSTKRPLNQFDEDRLVSNLEILKILLSYTANNPSQRFGQILRNTGILQDVVVQERGMEEWETGNVYIDRVLLHEEPRFILARMKKELEERNKQ